MFNKKDLTKIDNYTWEIPKTHRKKMKVPARVYASQGMLDLIIQDKSLEQMVSTATLPSLHKHVLAMPDVHQGYGACVGSVFASDLEEAIVSPGAIGFDINCLIGKTRILHSFGFYTTIKELEKNWQKQNVRLLNSAKKQIDKAEVIGFLKRKVQIVYRIKTKSGIEISATGEHPIYTPKGMISAEGLKTGNKIAVSGFKGVPYEESSSKKLLTKKNVQNTLIQLGRKSGSASHRMILKSLKDKGLLEISYNHPKLPYLLKILGFLYGDGTINFKGRRKDGVVSFYSKETEGLAELRDDIFRLGYTPSKIYTRTRKTSKSSQKDIYESNYFDVNAASLVVLLNALGIPLGKRTYQPYRVPKWIFKASLWQKRLFLAGLFGAELRIPHRRKGRRANFNCPVLVMNKEEKYLANGRKFLEDIVKLAKEFGVVVSSINQRRRHISKDGHITWALEIIFSCQSRSLINLWGKIGFEYERDRSARASVAVVYLKLKQQELKEKEEAIRLIPQLVNQGYSYEQIYSFIGGNPLTMRFIESIALKLKNGEKRIKPRISSSFPTFKEFLGKATKRLEGTGLVWDEIIKVDRTKFKGCVYDITVNHPEHNFFANGVVVSNCGVRILISNIKAQEVKDKIKNLAFQIQRDVPSGLGRGHKKSLNLEELNQILRQGPEYLVEQGIGEKQDLEHCEAGGRMLEANPESVSPKAKQRGADQVGTLGSGNHFLELQEVVQIFEIESAKAFKLMKGQLVVMIHSGSRGLGHQVASDYIKKALHWTQGQGIWLADRELAYVPFKSSMGQQYFQAMAAAANFAWSNRHMMGHMVRQAFKQILGKEIKVATLYDIAHNIGKIEKHQGRQLLVHRKGATRAFGAEHPEVPESYRSVGQPVLIPGSMGTSSWILVGDKRSEEKSFDSACHGAGRVMSRTQAKKEVRGENLKKELEEQGIVVQAGSMSGLAEEAPKAYKDVDEVVEIVHQVGLARKVAQLKPLAVIKG